MHTAKRVMILAFIPAAVLMGGCAGTDLKPVASFGASNMLSPSGYAETKISDTQYQVKATGTEATPKSRIEKIARARAAQIAVEQKMKYYKVTNVQVGALCEKKHEFYKGGATAGGTRQTVMLDVVYAKEASDPSFVSAKESFEALNGELGNDVIPSEEKAVAEQEARAACGQQI
jgi:hypothetical protein